VDEKKVASATPDRANFPHLKYPPFFCDLEVVIPAGSESGKKKIPLPELRIDGYVSDNLALSRSFSADVSKDKFMLTADDEALVADGSDATRVVFSITDQYGALRPFANGAVVFHISGPGVIVGDNPFTLLDDSGGVGAVWIKSLPNRPGRIVVWAEYSTWNGDAQTSAEKAVAIEVT
jgi:beta-galactosidase